MIVPRTFQFPRMVLQLGWPLVIFLLWDIAVVLSYNWYHVGRLELPPLPLPLVGSALAVFLAFRANTAYARWWEARTLWGAVVNASRSLTRQVLTMMDDRDDAAVALKRRLVNRQVAYAHALRCALRRQASGGHIAPFLQPGEADTLRERNNVPDAVLRGTAGLVAQAVRDGRLDTIQQARIEGTLVDLSNAQGGLERIKNTPMPRQYTFFPAFFVHVFCVLLPIGLVDSLGFYTPLVSAVVGFMLLTMDKIGDHIQDPFENTENDVPMDAICRTIEIDLLQAIGKPQVARPLQPVDDVLW